jgi:hypothetical protein
VRGDDPGVPRRTSDALLPAIALTRRGGTDTTVAHAPTPTEVAGRGG